MQYKPVCIMVLIALFAAAAVYGAEHFGVQVYPGARQDAGETAFLRKIGVEQGYFYRTGDKADKVVAFYLKQPGLMSIGHDANGGKFMKQAGDRTVYVTVESPWQPSKGGEMSKDTKILIVQE
jgi:hypothetical protein